MTDRPTPPQAPLPQPTASTDTTNLTEEGPQRVLWVGGLARGVRSAQLRALCTQHGEVASLRAVPALRCAFVAYSTPQEAAAARAALDGHTLAGRPLRVDFAKQQHAVKKASRRRHPSAETETETKEAGGPTRQQQTQRWNASTLASSSGNWTSRLSFCAEF